MAVKVMASSVMNASHKDRASGGDAESTAVIPPLDWRRDARSRGGLPRAQQYENIRGWQVRVTGWWMYLIS